MKDLKNCFDKIHQYEALPSKSKSKDDGKDNDEQQGSIDDDVEDEYKITRPSKTHNLLLRDCKIHKNQLQQKLANYQYHLKR